MHGVQSKRNVVNLRNLIENTFFSTVKSIWEGIENNLIMKAVYVPYKKE